MYKGSKAEFTVIIQGINQYDQYDHNLDQSLANLTVTVNVYKEDKTQSQYTSKITYNSTKKEAYVQVTVDYRQYYGDQSLLEVILHPTDCYPQEISRHIIKHAWYKAQSFEDIRKEE